jgi:Galactose oxidase-like, Early set domain
MALARPVLVLLVAALSLLVCASAQADHVAPAAADERLLHAEETATLGAEHAAEHARLRAYQRDPRWRRALERATTRAARARARLAATGRLDRTGRWPDGGEFDIRTVDGTTTFATHAVMLATGKVLWYSIPSHPDRPLGPRRLAVAVLWDPSKGTGPSSFKRVNPPIDPNTGQPVNIWCSGNSLLADGRVLVTGGNLMYTVESPGQKFAGLNHVYTFDPFTERWKRQPDMQHGRWYPTNLLLPDGRSLIMGGLDERGYGDKNEDLELFTPSRSRGGRGRVSLLGGSGVLGDPGRPPVGDYYPHLFWMPSGHGLVAGPWTSDTWWFSPLGNPPKLRWKDLGNSAQSRVWGTAVMLPAGPDGSHQVEQLGGSDKPKADALEPDGDALATNGVSLFDERHPDNGWNDTTSISRGALHHPRSHANTVLLPDGSMVEVGGGWGDKKSGGENGAPNQWAAAPFHLTTELWSPRSRTWRLGPPQREFRTYHSTALLLPDGRVVSAGDDYSGRFTGAEAARNFTQDSAEIFEPPYLFDGNRKAPRPKLRRAPALLTWNQATRLRVKAARRDRPVTRAVLVAPSSVTHAVDMNQRYVPLRVKDRDAGTLSVRTPGDADIAPPGYYMLFVLDRSGTPSVARWVRLA